LQAKAGDSIKIIAANGASYSGDYEVQSLWLYYGSGEWNLIGSQGNYGSGSSEWNITIPSGTASGNGGILVYNDFSSAGSGSYASANFYSLHIVADSSGPTGPTQKTVTLTSAIFSTPGEYAGWPTYYAPDISLPSDYASTISWNLYFSANNVNGWEVYYCMVGIVNVANSDYGYDPGNYNFSMTMLNHTENIPSGQPIKCFFAYYSAPVFQNCRFEINLTYMST
jgi:hypothetical protein